MTTPQHNDEMEKRFEEYLKSKGMGIYNDFQNDTRPMTAENMPRIGRKFIQINDSSGLAYFKVFSDFTRSESALAVKEALERQAKEISHEINKLQLNQEGLSAFGRGYHQGIQHASQTPFRPWLNQ